MSTKQAELQSCPFCGNAKPWIRHDTSSDHRYDWCHYGKCDCGAQGPEEKTEEDATTAWNTRST